MFCAAPVLLRWLEGRAEPYVQLPAPGQHPCPLAGDNQRPQELLLVSSLAIAAEEDSGTFNITGRQALLLDYSLA